MTVRLDLTDRRPCRERLTLIFRLVITFVPIVVMRRCSQHYHVLPPAAGPTEVCVNSVILMLKNTAVISTNSNFFLRFPKSLLVSTILVKCHTGYSYVKKLLHNTHWSHWKSFWTRPNLCSCITKNRPVIQKLTGNQ